MPPSNWLLGLPGWRTNAEFMNLQLKSSGWERGLRGLGWNVHPIDPYQDAQGPVDPKIQTILVGQAFQWYYIFDDERFQDGKRIDSIRESIDYIIWSMQNPPKHVQADGGYKGVIGFSQGAAMAFVMAAIKQFGSTCYFTDLPIQKVIMIASPSCDLRYLSTGAPPILGGDRSESVSEEWEAQKSVHIWELGETLIQNVVREKRQLNMKSLHCIGTNDFLYASSMKNLKYWNAPVSAITNNYHRFPPFSDVQSEVKDVLQ